MSDFEPGQYLTGQRSGKDCQCIILSKTNDGIVELLWIPDHVSQTVTVTDLEGWPSMALPDARWVEVFEPDNAKAIFAAYLPTLQAALGVLKNFDERKAGFR